MSNQQLYRLPTSSCSLVDLDCLAESLPQAQAQPTLLYIHSFCDIPQPSEQAEWAGRLGRDCFRSELDGLAFNKQEAELQSPDNECESLGNVSTSMNSEPHPVEPEPSAAPAGLATAARRGGCTCKKTSCLKMYCECFSSGLGCTAECGCLNCHNHSEHEELITRAREVAKHRFKQAYYNPLDGSVKKRCHCKKTQCRKKYCECYNMGLECNDLCKCEGCENGGHSHSHPDPTLGGKALIC